MCSILHIFHDNTEDFVLHLAQNMHYKLQIRGLSRKYTRKITMWTKPAATEMRFGFEVTMYVMNK